MDTITLTQLINAGACRDQLNLFKELFGESVQVTEEVAVKYAKDLDFQWAGEKLLSEDALATWRAEMSALLVQRRRLVYASSAEAWVINERAQNDYVRVYDNAWDEYRRAFCAAKLPAGTGSAARQSPDIIKAAKQRDQVISEARRVRDQVSDDVRATRYNRVSESWEQYGEGTARLFVRLYRSM